MENLLLKKVVNRLILEGNIEYEDRDIYTYGLHQGILVIVNIVTTILIGFLVGMIWESILFMVTYIPLRTYAGGYHTKTQMRCYLFSILLALVVLLAIKYILWTNFIMLGLALIAGAIIFILAPVGDENKSLSETEIIVYKSRTRLILIVELFTMLILMQVSLFYISVSILISIIALSIMLVVGRI